MLWPAPRQFRLERACRVATEHLEALNLVDAALLLDGTDLLELGIVGRHHQLAALAMRHAVRGAEFIQHSPPANAVPPAQGARGGVHATVDHLAVARGDACTDVPGGFRHA